MQRFLHIVTIALCVVGAVLPAFAQNNSAATDSTVRNAVIIRDIQLEGNKRTRPWIITRELDLSPGDTIETEELNAYLEYERNKIFNTQLFNVVEATYEIDGNFVDLNFRMEERWYIWPSVNIDLGDRNFNEWLLQRGARLDRLVYGVTFRDRNFRGRRENLKVKLQLGFTRKYELFYDVPYIDKNQKTGIGYKISYSDNNIVAYEVADHQLQFVDSEDIQRRRFYTQFYVTRRSEFFGRHYLEIGYRNNWIGDTIAQLNPNYFGDSLNSVQFLTLSYNYTWDKRNIAYYATRGHFIGIGIGQAGLGLLDDINLWEVKLVGAKYFDLGKKFYSSHYGSAKLSGPESQPFFLFRGLGYGKDVLRGFDLYVINGNYFLANKNELKYKLFSFRKTFNWIPLDQFQTLPVEVFIKVFADMGYADDRNTREINQRFSNRFLSGYGVGIDVATFYDLVFRTEYSINQDGEANLFLNLQAAF